jgi:hypothetical protein
MCFGLFQQHILEHFLEEDTRNRLVLSRMFILDEVVNQLCSCFVKVELDFFLEQILNKFGKVVTPVLPNVTTV